MLSKHKVDASMSGYRAVTRRISLLAFLLVGFAATAYAQTRSPVTTSPVAVTSRNVVPEIAVGAGISAFVLAGGGLLLLADRLRGKKKSKS